MVLDLNQYRAAIGMFNIRSNRNSHHIAHKYNLYPSFFFFFTSFVIKALFSFINLSISLLVIFHYLYSPKYLVFHDAIILSFFHVFFVAKMLMLSGDVHSNPGPKEKSKLSVLHWNLGSIGAHNFEKLHLLQAFNSVYKYDIICISETFLDSSYSNDDQNLSIDGYNIIRADYPGNIKRGGVCIFHKDTLPIRFLNIFQLNECIAVEIVYENKKCVIVSLYRSPS